MKRSSSFHVCSIIHPRIRNTESQRNHQRLCFPSRRRLADLKSDVEVLIIHRSEIFFMFRWKIKVCFTADIKTVNALKLSIVGVSLVLQIVTEVFVQIIQ